MVVVDARWLAGASHSAPGRAVSEEHAIALGDRLLDVEARTMALRAELGRARRELDAALSSGGSRGGGFEPPRASHPWPFAERPESQDEDLGQYDRRVDDPVVMEGRRGELFLSRFALAGDTPDFTGAVDELNIMHRHLRPSGSSAEPDVTIIIPIYGQLGYTLNCLHSLFSQESRYTTEIIVIDDRSPDASGQYLPRLEGIRYHLQPVNGGFIRSCNTGAGMARGRHVLMLNNDTRVAPGWLDALLDSFTLFPRAGLVGSKMCYADGSLQEAGGIIWRDGTCWNYGRNDDPNRPYYAHARQVDYVSGCSIVLTKALWDELGGFDPLYSPAYCEDADLCLRVSAAGHEVWFQPQSRVVHYEGKTSGTDISAGVKAYQVVNNRKLYIRWRERLELHRPNGEAPYFERERSARRRMLVVDVTMPTPNQDAGSVQTVLGLQVCRDAGYKTHFVAEDNWLFQTGYTTDLQKIGIECAYAPYELGFEAYIRRYGHLFDVVMVYRMNVLERVISQVRKYAPNAALLFHVADLHYLRRQREAELEGSAEGLAEAEQIKKRELALVAASDCTITHSPIERDILAEALPEAPVTVWPLMLELNGTEKNFSDRRDICFLGGYRHPPNVDAVKYFVREIFPSVRAADPSIRFLIAGANPNSQIMSLAGEGVEVLGMVEDLRDLFDRVRVFVCPLRFGAGVKGKIMSALSYGLPIVSTSIGIEGSGLVEGEHVLVADDPVEFARRTLQLYEDGSTWSALSKAGQNLLRSEFSLEMGRNVLRVVIDRAQRHRAGLDGIR